MAEASGDLGVVFPRVEDGSRSTSALGRAVVADALRRVDPAGARAAERETNWRTGYLVHLRRLVEAGLASPAAALDIAQDGLGSVHARMRVAAAGGDDLPLDEALTGRPGRALGTARVRGTAAPERELSLPYRRERLRGDALLRQVDAWVRAGVAEPSAGAAIRAVVANPDWLDLSDRTVVVLGAGAEMGPLQALLRWGATVAGVDLPRPALWRRVLETARRGAGTLVVPVDEGAAPDRPQPGAAGADLLQEPGAVADWLTGLEGPLVLGDYVYADGAANVRVSVAVDGLRQELRRRRDDVALAFLATPTDVFAVPADAVAHSTRAYQSRSRIGRLAGRPLRTLSGGRLLRRAYVAGQAPGIADSLVPQQGPNYALAKRLQRWRAVEARAAGRLVSLNVAPPTRTRSVVKNRALAAAYAGAHRFGVEVFEPATSNTLMAALLVHDLRTGAGALEHPWRDEASGAVHGGLWRTAYDPRSALGLAALLGLTSART
jgi:hypothetical protein